MMNKLTFRELGKIGRFGNQLFQIASTMGVAATHGREVCFPPWKNFDNVSHGGKDDEVLSMFKMNSLPSYGRAWPRPETWPTIQVPFGYYEIELPRRLNYNLSGFMQSEKYFKHIEAEIRATFATIDDPDIMMKTVCSVHIRRGDFVASKYTIPSVLYYERAVEFMFAQGFRKFYIFSDDPVAAAKLMIPIRELFGCDFQYMPAADYRHDFLLMKSCGGHIIANSSFSWWSAWLSSGPVVCPLQWFLPGSGLDEKDIPAAGWTSIDIF